MFGNNAAAQKINVEIQHQQHIQRLIQGYTLPEFTPDLWELEQKKEHRVFIHDDMMQLQPYHSLISEGALKYNKKERELEDGKFYPLQYGYTTKKFSFIQKELGLKSIPIALDLRDLAEELPVWIGNAQRIRGEVYAVRTPTLVELDNHRMNGVQFQRRRVNINIGYKKLWRSHWFNAFGNKKYEYQLGKEEMISVECWMYIGREDYWKDQLLADAFKFNPVDTVTEDRLWLTKYYQYSRVR